MTETTPVKALILDMDGTVTDNYHMVWDSISDVMQRFYGIVLTKEDILAGCGKAVRESATDWSNKYGAAVDLDLITRENWERQRRFIPNLKPNPGLIALLEDLTKEHGMPIAIGTSSKTPRTNDILSQLKIRDYMSAIVTADDVKHHKPAPDIFLEAARRLGVKPEEALAIDDAAAGIEAANRARMRSIGYLTPYNTREELAQANGIIKSFKELSYDRIMRIR